MYKNLKTARLIVYNMWTVQTFFFENFEICYRFDLSPSDACGKV